MVLSIAVGVFGVGMVAGAYAILDRDLSEGYTKVNPASAEIFTEPFGEDLLREVRRHPDVGGAEGRRRLTGRIRRADGEWETIALYGLEDFSASTISRVRSQTGSWPPPDQEMLLERSSVELLGVNEGDYATIETPDGETHSVKVAGLAHDITQAPSKLRGAAYGFVTMETMHLLGESPGYNVLEVVVARNALDERHIRRVAADLRDGPIALSGRKVLGTYIPEPGKHPIDDAIQTALFLFFALGLLSMALSGFLVVNTIEALLASQIRQIGIMKAVGAKAGQIIGIYLAMVLVYGVLGLAVGVPAAAFAARAISDWIAGLFNFDITSYALPPRVILIEVAVGIVIPVLAALYPVIRGTRVPARQAMDGTGQWHAKLQRGFFTRLLERPSHLPRQLLLAVRNTFRHKGRLALTLITLTLSGAIFIAVMSTRASLLATIDDIARYWQYDVVVMFGDTYAAPPVVRRALKEPGVAHAEAWNNLEAIRVRPDDTENENVSMITAPARSRFITAPMLVGRWLGPEDTDGIVVNKDFVKDEPDVDVGDEVTLKIRGVERTWKVVGVSKGELRGAMVYAEQDGAAGLLRQSGQANRLVVEAKDHSPDAQRKLATALEEAFTDLGYEVARTDTNSSIRGRIEYQFNILVTFLLIMAVILASVGGLGLMGTMSINVLERTREVAVMRAIGASDQAVVGIFMAEGVMVGLMGCAFGTLAAVPMSRLLSDTVGTSFFGSPLTYEFSYDGALLWLGVALVLAAIASVLPSLRASRISVRDALAYE